VTTHEPVIAGHSAETLRRRKVLSRTWGTFVVAWSIIRTLIVWAALGDYGINPWMYLGIDLVSAFVDAVTTPRMVLAFIDDRFKVAAKWLLVSALAFVIPDLYIFLGTNTLPKRIIVVICLIILLTTTVAAVSIFRRVMAGRRARAMAIEAVLRGS
jgi:hypothetical protein